MTQEVMGRRLEVIMSSSKTFQRPLHAAGALKDRTHTDKHF